MDERVWSGNEDRVYRNDPSDYSTYIRVNNSDRRIDPGSSFAQVVKETARNAGLGKFRVYLDGSEISPKDAPDSFSEGMGVELRPYDEAGC